MKNTEKTVSKKSIPEKMIKFIHDNLKALSLGLAAIAVFGLAIVAFGYYQDSKELKIEAALFEQRTKLTEILQNEAEKNKDKDKPSFELIQSATKTLEDKILTFSGSSSATTSALELGGIYLEYNQYDKAKNLLTNLKPKKGVLASLVTQQLATTMFEMKDYQGAIKMLDNIIASKDDTFLHPDALLKKGLAYHEMGDSEKAKSSLQQVAEEYAGKPVAQTASKYLRVLNFKSK